MYPQIIYAKAYGEDAQAMILRWGGMLYVGITRFMTLDHSYEMMRGMTRSRCVLHWDWCMVINEEDIDQYMHSDVDDWKPRQLTQDARGAIIDRSKTRR